MSRLPVGKPAPPGPIPGGAGQAALAGSLFAAASLFLYGYEFGTGINHGFYLPWVLRELGTAPFPGDAAVEAAGRAPTFFWRLLVLPASWLGLERSCFALLLAARAAGGFAAFRLASRLSRSQAGGWLALSLALGSWHLFALGPLGGDPFFKPGLDQSSFAWPLALLAVERWLAGRREGAMAGLGLLANLNPMTAWNAGAWLFLADARERGLRAAPGAALWASLASPVLLRAVRLGTAPDLSMQLEAMPQLYLASAWPWERWLDAASLGALAAALAGRAPQGAVLARLCAAALAWWLPGLAAAWLPALRPVLALQPFRLDGVLVWLLICWASAALLPGLRAARARPFAAALAGCAGLLSIYSPAPAALGTAVLLASKERPSALAALGAAWSAFGLASLSLDVPFRLGFLPSRAAVLGGLLLYGASREPEPRLARRTRVAALALAAAAAALPLARAALRRGLVPAGQPPLAGWRAPREARLLAPPWLHGLRVGVGRPVYAEWSELVLPLFDAGAARAWREREGRLGLDWSRLAALQAEHTRARDAALVQRRSPPPKPSLPWPPAEPELLALARSAGATHVVFARGTGPDWPEAAGDARWSARALPAPTASDARADLAPAPRKRHP